MEKANNSRNAACITPTSISRLSDLTLLQKMKNFAAAAAAALEDDALCWCGVQEAGKLWTCASP
jgi:hypothetical protein